MRERNRTIDAGGVAAAANQRAATPSGSSDSCMQLKSGGIAALGSAANGCEPIRVRNVEQLRGSGGFFRIGFPVAHATGYIRSPRRGCSEERLEWKNVSSRAPGLRFGLVFGTPQSAFPTDG